MGRWHGFEEMSGLNCSMNGGFLWAGETPPQCRLDWFPGRGHFAFCPQIPITARAEAPEDENMCKS